MAVASIGVIGTGVTDGTDIISIPVTVGVPRSDPAGGASLVVVLPIVTNDPLSLVTAVSDDAATDSFYSTHLYTDGLNPPYVKRAGPGSLGWNGLILNPLTSGDTITCQLDSPSSFGAAIAFAFTGVQVDNQSSPAFQVPDQPTLNWFDWLHIPAPFGLFGGNPFSGSGNTRYLQYSFDPVFIINPGSAVYPNWSIHEGELAVYFALSSNFTTVAPGDFVPADGTWVQIGALIDVPKETATPPNYPAVTDSIWMKSITAPELNDELDGAFNGAPSDMFAAQGNGISLIAGLGPIWAETPPPTAAVPAFNNRFRAAD